MNKNFLIAGGVVLAIGLAVAIGVTLVDEPLDGNLTEGETTVTAIFFQSMLRIMMTILLEGWLLQLSQHLIKTQRS